MASPNSPASSLQSFLNPFPPELRLTSLSIPPPLPLRLHLRYPWPIRGRTSDQYCLVRFPLLPSFPQMLLLAALLLFRLLVFPITTVTADPLAQICSPAGPDYAANSTFSTNLNRLLSSLPANASTTGFYNATAAAGTDRVYGLVLCRGDKGPGDCRRCLDTAVRDVPQTCPGRRSAVIWYDYCMLRYSDRAFFSVPDDTLKVALVNTQNLTEVAQFNRQLDALMRELVRYAAYNASSAPRMFATGEAEYGQPGTPAIYGLVQCTRDQSADECSACLRGILDEMPSLFFGKIGARYLKATCNYRYELYPFYNSSVMVSVPLSAANATPPTAALSPPTDSPPAPGKKKKSNSTGTILAIAISLSAAFALAFLICICFCRRKSKQREELYMRDTQEITTIESLLFNLSTLRAATGNFSELNLLGQGGFGAVYKGLLPSGQEIAVKRLIAGSGQGMEELKNEVVLLAKLQHRNLVRLLGVCLEGEEKLLVYEYVPNRSLDKFLFDAAISNTLNWERRYRIIGGIARGLQYLHEDSQVKIIHRDLKASNVLLDADMNAKISDFGLARLFAVDQTQATTSRVVGTFGYMSPEYAMRGHFSNKSDVFSFGVLVLEIVTGQRNGAFSDSSTSTDLLTHVWEHWTSGTVLEIVDPCLNGQYQSSEVLRCVQIGLLCVHEAPAERPTMTSVVLALSSDSVLLQVPRPPAYIFSPPNILEHPTVPPREADTRELMSRIFSPGDYNPSVVAVVGMGGVGKTTLVQHVYNDQAVSEHFELRGWVCVYPDDYEVVTLTKRIIEAITKERCDLNELSPIQEILVKLLSGKRFLLVLDDLWNPGTDLWFSLRAALLYGLQGSTIVTITRDENVARLTQTTPSIHVGQSDDCWAAI